jgi:hypothetical protein
MYASVCKKALVLAVSALLAGAAGLAQAQSQSQSQWDKDHPRRAEVNKRLSNQNKRIDAKVADGQMSKAEAAKLHREDHQIRQEERTMASHDNGHITKADQRALNQQENDVSRQIQNH